MLAGVLDHLWQSTLLALGLGLLTLAFRTARAGVRHGLWFAASLKFLVPFAVLAMAGRFLAPPGLAPPQEAALIQTATAPLSRFPLVQSSLARTPIVPSPIAHPTVPQVSSSPHMTPAVHAVPHLNLGLILLALWIAGCIAVLVRWMIRWARVRAVVRSARPLAWSAPMPVLASPFLLEPGLIGFLRPVLVIPQTLPDHLAKPEIDAIVAHEACHLRRRDNLTATVHMLVEALFWFYPLVWWIGARLIEERERACDEAVVRAGHDRAAYARSLVESCRLYLQSPLSCVAGASGSDLTVRVALIMTAPTSSPLSSTSKAALGFAGFCALAAPVTAGLLTAPPESLKAVERVMALAAPGSLVRAEEHVLYHAIAPLIAPGPVLPPRRAGDAAAITLVSSDIPSALEVSGPETSADPSLAAQVQSPEAQFSENSPSAPPSPAIQSARASEGLAAIPISYTVAPLTVQAAPPPKVIQQQTRSFVRSLAAAANPEAGQIARWRDPICVRVAGLPDAQDAAIKTRIEEVARSIDVRVLQAGCQANIQVMFTTDPQALMDSVAKTHEYMLGYYHRHDRDQLKRVIRPIQAWYVTATENNDPNSAAVGQTFVGGASRLGRGVIDDPDQVAPPGCDDAPRIRSCRRSLISNVLVVADAKALQGQDAGLIADYLVMLTLAQPRSLDGCDSLASVVDLLARGACPSRDAPKGLTASDAAYLTSLYKADLETRMNFAEADISDRMAQLLIKAWAPSNRQ